MTKRNFEFEAIMSGQLPTSEQRFARLADDPDALAILQRIPMNKDEIVHEDFLELEELALDRYGLWPADAFKLVVDYWRSREVTKGPKSGD